MKRLCILMLIPLLTSCSFVSLERQIYPICMSVDKTDDGKIQLGIQAPKSGGSSTDQANYAILTASGETFDEALRILSASTPYPLHFGQIRLCLIGYPLASALPLRPLLETILELPTMRPNAYVSISMGNAMGVMQNQQPDLGMRLSTHLSLMITRMQREQLLPDSMLSYCVRELSDGRSDLLIGVSAVNPRLVPQETSQPPKGSSESTPAAAMGEPWTDALVPENLIAGLIPHNSDNPVEYLGSAVVSNGAVTGVLTADQTQLCLRLLDEAKRKVARDGEALQLQIHLPKDSPLSQSTGAVSSLMETLQTLRSDPLLFGCIASGAFLTEEAWQAYDFRHRYPEADVWIGVE